MWLPSASRAASRSSRADAFFSLPARHRTWWPFTPSTLRAASSRRSPAMRQVLAPTGSFRCPTRSRALPVSLVRLLARPDAEVAEALSGVTLSRIGSEYRVQALQHTGLVHVFSMKPVQPLPPRVAAEVQVVPAGRLPHERDLRHVRARAPVGTACDPERDRLLRESVFGEQRLHALDEGREVALRLGHRQPARG